jgi:hypothetical protein
MHDTIKKPQDLLLASYAIRYPERGLKSKNHTELENYVDVAVCVSFSSVAILFCDGRYV